jgi:hypothetical protein
MEAWESMIAFEGVLLRLSFPFLLETIEVLGLLLPGLLEMSTARSVCFLENKVSLFPFSLSVRLVEERRLPAKGDHVPPLLNPDTKLEQLLRLFLVVSGRALRENRVDPVLNNLGKMGSFMKFKEMLASDPEDDGVAELQ